eukprot:3458763-Amphidinium_carterae.1
MEFYSEDSGSWGAMRKVPLDDSASKRSRLQASPPELQALCDLPVQHRPADHKVWQAGHLSWGAVEAASIGRLQQTLRLQRAISVAAKASQTEAVHSKQK